MWARKILNDDSRGIDAAPKVKVRLITISIIPKIIRKLTQGKAYTVFWGSFMPRLIFYAGSLLIDIGIYEFSHLADPILDSGSWSID